MTPHKIRPNERCESLRHIVVVDTETTPESLDARTVVHRLAFGWAAYVRRLPKGGWSTPIWHRFVTPRDCWDWVESLCRPRLKLRLYCHNSSFDLPVLDTFRELPRRGWVAHTLVIDAPPTIIAMRKGAASLQILDTLNWWRMPLARLGEALGLPKFVMPDGPPSADEWDIYCQRDVEILLRAITQWADLLVDCDLGGYAPTLASQAMRAYRHRFMAHSITVHQDTWADALSRECYHGGRCEAWWIGKSRGEYYLYDVTSMYPYVMRNYLYPTSLQWYSRHVYGGELRDKLRSYHICAHVRVRVSEPGVGVVRDHKLIYPVGEFDAHLSTPELRWVLEHGEIVAVYEAAIYRRAMIFREFVDYFWSQRRLALQDGRAVDAWMYKILMNSLYGKFGQRGMVFTDIARTDDLECEVWDEVDADTGVITRYRQVMGVIQRLERKSESRESMPAIAAHVTAYARMVLWNLACIAGREHVYYMDTDSLLVDREGSQRLGHLVAAGELGQLKLEGRYEDVEIHGCKDYRLDNARKIKGIRATARDLGDGRFAQDRWAGLRGLLSSGRLDLPVTQEIEKRLSRSYDKGIVGPDGWVTPLVLGEADG